MLLAEAPKCCASEFVFQPYYHPARVPAEMSIFVFQNFKPQLVFTPPVTERAKEQQNQPPFQRLNAIKDSILSVWHHHDFLSHAIILKFLPTLPMFGM